MDLTKDTRDYIKDLKERIEKTHEIVKRHSEDAQKRQKSQFDKRAKVAKITVGEKVLVKILSFDGKHKISDKFEEQIYEVIEQPRPDIPVFRIKSGSGVEKTLHRNHLLPIGKRDDSANAHERPRPIPRKRTSLDKPNVTEAVNEKDASNLEETAEKNSAIEEKVDYSEYSDSESSEDDIGQDYVAHTYKHGDAHGPTNEKLQEQQDVRLLYSQDRAEAGMAPKEKDSDDQTEQSNSVTDGKDKMCIDSDIHEVAADREHENFSIETGQSQLSEEEEERELNVTQTTSNNEFTPDRAEEENHNTELGSDRLNKEQGSEVVEGRQNSCPSPTQRRSTRQRKPPAWLDSYQVNQMVARPYDSRLESLNVLLNSGILAELDSEVAHKIIKSIMD